MGKASSSKKIQRVQRAGARRVSGQRRPLGFPLALVAIFVVGGVLIFFARSARSDAAAAAPLENQDHWHYAYGIYKCDSYPAALQKLTDKTPDVLGIHSHGDGLVHIHPFSTSTAGKRATLQKFANQEGLGLSDTKITFPASVGGGSMSAGQTCTVGKDKKKVKGVLELFSWPPQANKKVKPKIITSDFGSFRFTQDQGIIALALVPPGTKDIPLPPSITALQNPTAAEGGSTPQPDTGNTSTTLATGSTIAPDTGATSVPTATTPVTTPSPSTTAPK
jgi:hypothetical protein